MNSSQRRKIDLFPNYTHTWCLWEGQAINAADLGLSAELSGALERWYYFWESHLDIEDGWDSLENHDAYLAEGVRLAELLRLEVKEYADVELHAR